MNPTATNSAPATQAAASPPRHSPTRGLRARHRRHDLRVLRPPGREGPRQGRRRLRGEVNLATETASVLYDPTRVDPAALTAAVAKAGYTGTPRPAPATRGSEQSGGGTAPQRTLEADRTPPRRSGQATPSWPRSSAGGRSR